ncbi:hypothetical protein CVT25_005763 [Psilocybe cyanescens]|uniref:Uncharacterized protein n=1 Tax=Psilocybe cyanescens TaxID=93625 RepID=A0A409VLL8_PSICY|nr:hypothetical protein CVT25_005763 [Psilocybe cyanescens]
MAFYRNPVVATVPYADSQGPESPAGTAPDDIQAFYDDMERREILERKLSKRRSNSGASIWSRKSLKRWTITPPPVPPSPADLPGPPSSSNLQDRDDDDEAIYGGEHQDRPRLATSRSVIADNREIPAFADSGAWAAVPLPAFKVKYPLHNPFGPRRYRNHHLIPPSQKRPSMRPPTFFSPSFPPMHTSSAPEHEDDRPESSNTNAHSPLPTPTSSQTRVAEGGKPRSRKTSQTTPDNVDLLDVTDPWGTNWHHQSPYDIGQTTPATSDPYDIPNRTRRASMTAMQNRNKSVTPSPLSQSTSAVHLHPPQPEIHIPRKLSKRRTPTAENVFNPQPPEIDRKTTSAPVTPVERRYVAPSQGDQPTESLPKRMSVVPAPMYSTLHQTPKKEKRGSMLNRLAKKFSLLKKPSEDNTSASDWWHHIDSHETKGYTNAYDPPLDKGRTSPQKSVRDSVKRIPPPSVDNLPEPPPAAVETVHNSDRLSVASVEAPYSMGRLTITNPDLLPDAEKGTPIGSEPPLPPEKPDDVHIKPHVSVENTLSQNPPPAQIHTLGNGAALPDIGSRFDKPLPPPHKKETPKKTSSQSRPFRNADASTSRNHASEHSSQVSPISHNETRDRSGEASTSTQPSKPSQSNSRLESASIPAAGAVPFPSTQHLAAKPLMSEYESSPLSTSSMIANPPTPYDHRLSIAMSDQTPPTLPPKSIYEGKSPQNHSPINPSPGRQTETFKLVRSSSGNVYASNQTITAAGQQWEVVESVEVKGKKEKSSSKFKDQEHKSRNQEYGGRDHDYRSREYERQSKDYDYRPRDERRSRDYDRWSRDQDKIRDEFRYREDPRTMDEYRSREGQRAREEQLAKDERRVREAREERLREEQRVKEKEEYRAREREERRIREARDEYRLKEEQRARDERRAKEEQRTREERRAREEKRAREERKAREREEQKAREWEEQKARDWEEQKARERGERKAREREEQKAREREERKAREREEQKAREREEQKAREREEQKAREREGQKAREREEQRAHEREEQKAREREEKKAREREEQKAREREEQRAREREEQKAREQEEQRARELEEQKSKDEESVKEERRRKDYGRRSRDDYKSGNHHRGPNDRDHRSNDFDLTARDYEYKYKEHDHGSRRETKKEPKSKHDIDDANYYRSSYWSSPQAVQYPAESSNSRSNDKTTSHHRGEQSRHEEKKPGRKRDVESRPVLSDTSSSSDYYGIVIKPHPIDTPAQFSNPPQLRLERNPSLTARPTSELPSAAEMDAVRAKESWEMERLWKARSMYGFEPNAQTTNFIPGSSSSSSRSDDAHTQSAVYGSSHTAYVVQAPFQGSLGTQIYHSMPTGPPPVIYSSPASIPSIPDNLSSYEPYEHVYRSFAAATPSDYRSPATIPRPSSDYRHPGTIPRPPLNNPLPEPPRESQLELNGLKNTKSSDRHSHSNDYWTKYNGVTTIH